ncbi:hypothetical protein FRB94_012963 [Tulasnella sp. JGI-2019a]|nr:hypothetical protein FRB93_010512 [Tulasnella sp. JGI-2019a]KAG8990955.1 hypothetical protein FRB94_012963 [Tulasnella sp. JGI-2019a]
MSPTKASTLTPNTSAELATIASEISRSVAGDLGGGQSKRAKHVEKTKLQHLTKQLAMRLQYAKLKVDHGWARQNLNEVENLYFHHYGKHQPASQMSFTMRVPVAGTFRSLHTPTGEPGPSTSKSPVLPVAEEDPESEADGSDTQDIHVDSGPADPSRSQNAGSPYSQLRQSSGSRAVQARQGARPYPAIGAAASTTYAGSKGPFPSSSRTTPHPSVSSHSAVKSPTMSHALMPRSPTKSPGKSRAPSSTHHTPRLTKTQNKNTSTPSTLKPPITENSTIYKPSPSLTSVMGVSGVGALGSGLAGQSTGPTSYESFWSSLGSGSGLGMTSATAAATSRVGSSAIKTTREGKSVAVARTPAADLGFSPDMDVRRAAMASDVDSHDTTTFPNTQQQSPLLILSPGPMRSSVVPLSTQAHSGTSNLLHRRENGGRSSLVTNGTSLSSSTALLVQTQSTLTS